MRRINPWNMKRRAVSLRARADVIASRAADLNAVATGLRVEAEGIDAEVARLVLPTGLKRCYACGNELAAYEFHKDSHQSDGLQTKCKVCCRTKKLA